MRVASETTACDLPRRLETACAGTTAKASFLLGLLLLGGCSGFSPTVNHPAEMEREQEMREEERENRR
jgi:hypothetical protein